MNTNQAKEIVRSFYEGYNGPDLDAAFERYVAPDLVNHFGDGSYGRDGWLDWDRGWRVGFSDFTAELLDQVAEGDRVATRLRLGGTHDGTFGGIPASGKKAYFTGMLIDRVENGVIVEHWSDLGFEPFFDLLAGKSDAS